MYLLSLNCRKLKQSSSLHIFPQYRIFFYFTKTLTLNFCNEFIIQVIFDNFASDWIIGGRSNELRDLLQGFDDERVIKQIENWEHQGSVLLDYFQLKSIIEDMQAKQMVSEFKCNLCLLIFLLELK